MNANSPKALRTSEILNCFEFNKDMQFQLAVGKAVLCMVCVNLWLRHSMAYGTGGRPSWYHPKTCNPFHLWRVRQAKGITLAPARWKKACSASWLVLVPSFHSTVDCKRSPVFVLSGIPKILSCEMPAVHTNSRACRALSNKLHGVS